MRKILLTLFIQLSIFFTYAQETSITNSLKLLQAASKSDLIAAHTINPDFALLKISKSGGKWHNYLGMNVNILQYQNNNFNIGFHVNPFIELHDFRKNQDMSWELWRGHLGGNIFFESKPLSRFINNKAKLIFGLGYTHESQHATNLFGYQNTFMNNPNISTNGSNYYFFNTYGNLRTFEYWEFTLLYKQKIGTRAELFSQTGFKAYPKPLAIPANYDLKYSINQEIGFLYSINNNIKLNANIYLERIGNSFESLPIYSVEKPIDFQFKKTWHHQPFKYNHLEIGAIFKNKEEYTSYINLFFGFQKSNGRGLDFINQYKEWYGGIKIVL